MNIFLLICGIYLIGLLFFSFVLHYLNSETSFDGFWDEDDARVLFVIFWFFVFPIVIPFLLGKVLSIKFGEWLEKRKIK